MPSGIYKHKPCSEETERKIGKANRVSSLGKTPWNKGLKGYLAKDKHYNWHGGITPINKAIRNSFEYEEWRKAVFERDNYTCQHCEQVGGRLHADHIKPFALFVELRLEVSNGRT